MKISVTKADAVVSDAITLTEGMVGVRLDFAFSPEWEGLAKWACFENGVMDLPDKPILDNTVIIPSEALKAPNVDLSAGVYGKAADGTLVIPTVYAVLGHVNPGAKRTCLPDTPPTPDWAADIQQQVDEAVTTAKDVERRANDGEFDGADGFSPKATAVPTSTGAKITVTDASGTTEAELTNGVDGTDGVTPDIQIGKVETLAPGSQATATMGGTAENPLLNLGIPEGQQGKSGGVDVASAVVGQIIEVAEVDEAGKPTKWQAVDKPKGGISVKDAKVGQLIRAKAVDETGNITEYEPVPWGYEETKETVTFPEQEVSGFTEPEPGIFALLNDPTKTEFIVGKEYSIKWDGVKYGVECKRIGPNPDESIVYIGNISLYPEAPPEFPNTGEPFLLVPMSVEDVFWITNQSGTSHTIQVKTNMTACYKIPEKFLSSCAVTLKDTGEKGGQGRLYKISKTSEEITALLMREKLVYAILYEQELDDTSPIIPQIMTIAKKSAGGPKDETGYIMYYTRLVLDERNNPTVFNIRYAKPYANDPIDGKPVVYIMGVAINLTP